MNLLLRSKVILFISTYVVPLLNSDNFVPSTVEKILNIVPLSDDVPNNVPSLLTDIQAIPES